MQWPTNGTIGSFRVQFGCNTDSIWIDFCNAIQSAINLENPRNVCLYLQLGIVKIQASV